MSSHCVPSDFKRTMLKPGVDGRQVERQAIEAPPLQGRFGCREVAVPGLVGCSGKWNVEPDFDDPVVRSEHRLAHGDEPGCVAMSTKP